MSCRRSLLEKVDIDKCENIKIQYQYGASSTKVYIHTSAYAEFNI